MLCFGSCKHNRMTRCGIGPEFSIITVICGVLASWLTHIYPQLVIRGIPFWVFLVTGSVLVIKGVIDYIRALCIFNKAYQAKKLITYGPYAKVRHPIYAAWIIFICPGVVLLFRSWPMLLLPVIAYLSFKISIHREDSYLQDKFGQEYLDYRAETNELFGF